MLSLLPFVERLLGPSFAKFAKPLIYLVLGLTILGALWGGKCAYDHKVIAAHDSKQEAATAKADKKADNHAADARVADVSREQAESTQTQEAINEAKRTGADPRAAYYKCIQLQQSARRALQPPPKC